MREIPLYVKYKQLGDKTAIVDDDDYEFLNAIRWYEHKHGYVYGSYGNKQVYMHRLVNNTPEGLQTDHINRNKKDNRKENLRNCTRFQNQTNAPKPNGEIKYRGVTTNKRKTRFIARIKINGHHEHLGSFRTPKEAAMEYNVYAYIYHGEFATLNKITN